MDQEIVLAVEIHGFGTQIRTLVSFPIASRPRKIHIPFGVCGICNLFLYKNFQKFSLSFVYPPNSTADLLSSAISVNKTAKTKVSQTQRSWHPLFTASTRVYQIVMIGHQFSWKTWNSKPALHLWWPKKSHCRFILVKIFDFLEHDENDKNLKNQKVTFIFDTR